MTTTNVLLLDSSLTPLGVTRWQHAVVLVLEEKARIIEDYAGRFVHSANLEIPWPAVVALNRYVGHRRAVRFNRENVLARDGYACAYCGMRPIRNGRPALDELTLDHVVPRAKSKNGRVRLPWSSKWVPVTCWENVVTCCVPCNSKKGARLPEQAGMRLAARPIVPTAMDAVRMTLGRVHIPEEWKEYVPEDLAEWREYWTVDLEAD